MLAVYIGFDISSNVFHVLKQLHGQKFYQRLHLIAIFDDSKQAMDHIASIPGLHKMYFELFYFSRKLNLNSFKYLKELGLINYFSASTVATDLSDKSMLQLERLYLHNFSSEMMEPFIQCAAELNAIKIVDMRGDKLIDLSALNKKREKLFGAKKVVIYLEEDVYMATKWGNRMHDFKTVEIRRASSYDWPMHFTNH